MSLFKLSCVCCGDQTDLVFEWSLPRIEPSHQSSVAAADVQRWRKRPAWISGPQLHPPASPLIRFTATVLWTLRLISLVHPPPPASHAVWQPHCLIQWVHLESGCHLTTPHQRSCSWQDVCGCLSDSELQRVFDRVPAVCPRLSAAACYKACVICSAKCRPQTQGQLRAAQQRHPVPPGPPLHTGSWGPLRVPLSGPPEPASALMSAGSRGEWVWFPSRSKTIPAALENQTEDLSWVICFVFCPSLKF